MIEKKIQKSFIYEGFGFPIVLQDVPMIKIRGIWTPDVNYNKLEIAMMHALSLKTASLSGNEIKFIRKYFKLTLQAFGSEFGVSHAAVIDWESKENNAAKINPATEKCIRLYILDALKIRDNQFRESYQLVKINKLALQQKSKQKIRRSPLKLNMRKIQSC